MVTLEAGHVVRRTPVVRIGACAVTHVHDDGRRHEPLQGNRVGRCAPGVKVDRRVEVRAAVFGRRERVGGVEKTALRGPEREALQLERGR